MSPSWCVWTEGVAEGLELREDVEVGSGDVLNQTDISLHHGIFSIVTNLGYLKQTMGFKNLLIFLLSLSFWKNKLQDKFGKN